MAGTALTLIDGRPLPTKPLNVESLPPPERDRHRAELGVVVEAMLASWFCPTLSQAATTAAMVDWMDELQGYRPAQVRAAFVAYRDEDAAAAQREGRAPRRPNAAQIRAILSDRWGRRVIAQAKAKGLLPEPEPTPEPVSRERAMEILAAAGFRPRRMNEAGQAAAAEASHGGVDA